MDNYFEHLRALNEEFDDLPPSAEECEEEMRMMDPAIAKVVERKGCTSDAYKNLRRRYSALQEKVFLLNHLEAAERLGIRNV